MPLKGGEQKDFKSFCFLTLFLPQPEISQWAYWFSACLVEKEGLKQMSFLQNTQQNS